MSSECLLFFFFGFFFFFDLSESEGGTDSSIRTILDVAVEVLSAGVSSRGVSVAFFLPLSLAFFLVGFDLLELGPGVALALVVASPTVDPC